MTPTQVVKSIFELKIPDNAFVVLRTEFPVKDEFMHEVLDTLSDMGKKKICIVNLLDGQDISSIDEMEMKKAGWVRDPSTSKD